MRRWIRQLLLAMALMPVMVPAYAASPDWTAYARVLRNQVRVSGASTWVDYPALRSDADFSQTVKLLATTSLPDSASRDARLAYYINAYNILAMKVVADHWPVASIRDVGSLFTSVWKMPAGQVGGRTMTLDELEHGKIRPLGDPRIHFAIVCASRSCPDLRREPYLASRLNAQLDDQVRQFLANTYKGLEIRQNVIHASRIFDWFDGDFAGFGGPLGFVREYRPDIAADARFKPDLVYNWSVNGSPAPRQ